MILILVLVVLVIALWLYSMYLSWKISSGTATTAVHESVFVSTAALLARLGRRGWYSSTLGIKRVASWSNKRLGSLFLRAFPSARPAFTKKDVLTGLSHGQSSFFLKSISVQPKQRLPKSKKML